MCYRELHHQIKNKSANNQTHEELEKKLEEIPP